MGRPLAVITGGSSGIGLALARGLLVRDYRIILAARGEERLQAAARSLGGDVQTVVCNVAEEDSVAALARTVERHGGGLDLLVGNAGIPRGAGVLSADAATAARVMDVNYIGLVRVTHALWPALEQRRGRVINVVSIAGTVTAPGSAPYAASKHAALAFSRALAAAGRASGVRVLTVNPGPVATAGFPQSRLLRSRLLRRFVLTDEACARSILLAFDRRRTEVTVPRIWRAVGVLAALAPTTVVRISGRTWKPDR